MNDRLEREAEKSARTFGIIALWVIVFGIIGLIALEVIMTAVIGVSK